MKPGIEQLIRENVSSAMQDLFQSAVPAGQVALQKTKPEFEGDVTLLVFPLTKASKKSPEETANAIGNYLKEKVAEVSGFNVVKGFLNLVINDSYWIGYLTDKNPKSEIRNLQSETVMVEYSSPNTNKPLHLGHIRNNLLGDSISRILKAAGKKVIRVNLVNDRGIHICKSMQAWLNLANRETPSTTRNPELRKGDKFVGHYYVEFDKGYKAEVQSMSERSNEFVDHLRTIRARFNLTDGEFKARSIKSIVAFFLYAQIRSWKNANKVHVDINNFGEFLLNSEHVVSQLSTDLQEFLMGYGNEVASAASHLDFNTLDSPEFSKRLDELFKTYAPIVYSAHLLLRGWEQGEKWIIDLWKDMNSWVYDGFAVTYKRLGVEFEKTYYESNTYLLGKKVVEEGLAKGIFQKKPDGSVRIDLTADGLDEKVLLRSDGTSVYITQDLGTAIERQKEYSFNRLVYVVGNEQDYHFKVLFLILKKLGYAWADKLHHLSYGMVDLPSGKMKSREGTVVDADNLMDQMEATAKQMTLELGKTEGLTEEEAANLYRMIGMAALKYFILKVDPKKRMLFNPQESIDFNGNTGPFIQYTYARIRSVLRKANSHERIAIREEPGGLHPKEKNVIKLLHDLPKIVQEAAEGYNPGHVANYVFDLAKEFNQFYQELSILKAEKKEEMEFRLLLAERTAETIKYALSLLGIEVPERM